MTDKDNFDDLEFDGLQGNIQQTKKTIREGIKIDPEQEEWKACVKRLESHLEKTWVAIPRKDNQISIYDLDTCTAEQFFEWLCVIWPSCKTMNHSARDYKGKDAKVTALVNIIKMHGLLKFPKTDFSG